MEIEVKILEVDPAEVSKKLAAIYALKIFEGNIHTNFYDTPNGSIKKRKDLLRLRAIDKTVILTHKKFKSNIGEKIRDEHETSVGNFDEMHSILEGLGYIVTLKMNKRRTSFKLPDAEVDIDIHLDEYASIPPLMEIEAKNGDVIEKVARDLGFSKNRFSTWDFFEVARHYGYDLS
jgi:adenylate cyclase class 2